MLVRKQSVDFLFDWWHLANDNGAWSPLAGRRSTRRNRHTKMPTRNHDITVQTICTIEWNSFNGEEGIRCFLQRRSRTFSYNINRTTATEAVDKIDRFYGPRYHDRSISNRLHSSETKTIPKIIIE